MKDGEHMACKEFMNFEMVRHSNEKEESEGKISLNGMNLYGVSSCEVILTDLGDPKIKLEMTVNIISDVDVRT